VLAGPVGKPVAVTVLAAVVPEAELPGRLDEEREGVLLLVPGKPTAAGSVEDRGAEGFNVIAVVKPKNPC
jgi:hypothetical protein